MSKIEKIKDFWCPNCKKKGMHFYTKRGVGLWGKTSISKINHIWCLYCNLKIDSAIKESKRIRENK